MKALTLALFLSVSLAEPFADRVYSLKGWNDDKPFPFKMYSGYLPILGQTKQLHYLYLDSQSDPSNDPLIVWFNGGPGCSSMLGLTQEHGPYILPDGQTKFVKNEYSWNKEANMLYIEAPAGVGYSYCIDNVDKTNCNFDDNNEADDNLAALLYFFNNKFPERKSNDLYLSGESYAGIYVPLLAWRIDDYNWNHATDKQFQFNLKGFMVGNGVTNWAYDTFPAYIEMGYWHGLYDTATYEYMHANHCPVEYENFEFKDFKKLKYECQTVANKFDVLTKDINVYNIFGQCYRPSGYDHENPEHKYVTMENEDGTTKRYKRYATYEEYTPWIKKYPGYEKRLQEVPPCVFGQPIIDFLNQPYVREALHIPTRAPEIWDLCRGPVDGFNYTENQLGTEWVYRQLSGKYRILKFSGDTDGSVPTLGTFEWISGLNQKIVKPWQQFHLGKEVAGYFEEYEGLTLMTVHGAGHMVPQFKPAESYEGIFKWIKKEAPFN